MAKPTTPEEWLTLLTRRADEEYPHNARMCRYVNGDAPVPEASKNTQEAWIQFQKTARTNWGLLIVEAVVNRMIPNGIVVDGSATSAVAKQAQQIWLRNRMQSVFREWARAGLTYRRSYLTTWTDDEGKALIAADSPDSMCVSVDPLQPWKVRAAARWWRDLDSQRDECMVWMYGRRQKFFREIGDQRLDPSGKSLPPPVRLNEGSWTADGDAVDTSGAPPVVVYNNPGDAGEFELHIDLIDRINRGLLERLSTSAMQAYKQRALKKEKGVILPQKDADGNDIDYGAVFQPGPGIIWDLPPGVELWESGITDITPMLTASKDDIRQLSAATRTPFPTLMPDSANQTASGAESAKDGHIFKCSERLDEAEVGIEAAMAMALETEGVDLSNSKVDVMFKPVDRVTLAEMYAAARDASQAGESWQSIARNILGYSPEQIAQDNLDRAQERLLALAAAPTPPPQPETPALERGRPRIAPVSA